MTSGFDRYAVYWIPQSGTPLARFGAHWTGWCADAGEPRETLLLDDFDETMRAHVKDVRRHGLHGQFRAPVALAKGRSVWALETALEKAAEEARCTVIPRLHLALVDGRMSLAPADGDTELDRLTLRLSRKLSPLSVGGDDDASAAPITYSPRALETPVGAIPVLPRRSFHIPLSDRLNDKTASRFAAAIAPLILPHLDEPQMISDIALVGDPGIGRPVRLLRRFSLRELPVAQRIPALPAAGPRLYSPLQR